MFNISNIDRTIRTDFCMDRKKGTVSVRFQYMSFFFFDVKNILIYFTCAYMRDFHAICAYPMTMANCSHKICVNAYAYCSHKV